MEKPTPVPVPVPVPGSTSSSETCPHSHLHVNFLKKIGKAVEAVGKETVETALTVALSGLGAFSEE